LLPRHVEAITGLRNLIDSLGAYVKIVIVNHIHDSVVNEQNLVTAAQRSRLSVDCVFITTKRTGELGRLRILKSVTAARSSSQTITQGFWQSSRRAIKLLFKCASLDNIKLNWEFSTWFEGFIRFHHPQQ
jgi:hypothetical protein